MELGLASVYSVFIHNMKRLMELHRFSSLELSRRSGVANTRLSAMLRHYENPTLETMERISAALGVSFVDMFSYPDRIKNAHDKLPIGYDRVNDVVLTSFRAFQVRQWGIEAEETLKKAGFLF
ncbi:MAG: helix-turn-helix domain-containing protein [Azoarcus sp.]|jgi:transcriptional regulator with XRE-family HTH domain|nr:helix-turn-helix domain-containing protein [Azoarcus sp.]